jgi:hypothetical protein
MEFKLNISTNFGYAVNVPKSNIGTTYVQEIRFVLGCDLPLDRISIRQSLYQDPKLIVDFEDALKLNIFDINHDVKLIVGNGALNDYVFLDWSANRDPETGEVLRLDIALFLDNNSVIQALINGELEYKVCS